MEKQFSSLGISLIRIDAIEGKMIDNDIINKVNNEQNTFAHFGKMHYGEIGCFDSFVKSFGIISKQKEDFAILLKMMY